MSLGQIRPKLPQEAETAASQPSHFAAENCVICKTIVCLKAGRTHSLRLHVAIVVVAGLI